MTTRKPSAGSGPAIHAVCALSLCACAVSGRAEHDLGVTTETFTAGAHIAPAPAPARDSVDMLYVMEQISGDGAFSPQPGDRYDGGLDARVPMFGVTAAPDDLIVAYVYDAVRFEFIEIGRTHTDATAMMAMGTRRVYPYDFGSACLVGCEVGIPLHAWAGFGPYVAQFRFWSRAQGWLDLAGECLEGDGAEPCATREPLPLGVVAEPRHAH